MKTNKRKNFAICLLSWEYGRTGYVEPMDKGLENYCFYFHGGGKIGVFKDEFLCPEIQGDRPQGMNVNLFK